MTEQTDIIEKKQSPQPRKNTERSGIANILDYVELFAFALCVVLVIFSFFFRLCNVVGPSMEQTLYENERLIVSDLGYKPERYDIIVFHETGILNEPIVKRVIATEGETVDIDFDTFTVTVTDKNGNVTVLDEPYMYLDGGYATLLSSQTYPYTVEEGHIFVMGDNRNHSTDSRSVIIGTVDERQVLGKVVIRLSPIDKFGKVD